MMSEIKKSSSKLVSSEIANLENREQKEAVYSSLTVHSGWRGQHWRNPTAAESVPGSL